MTTRALLLLALVSPSIAAAEAPEGYPEFSWDHVPLHVHVGLGRGLEPEEHRLRAPRLRA